MARFYGTLQNKTAIGTTNNGISAHVRGWDVGVAIRGQVNAAGKDEFDIYITGGSNGHSSPRLLATVTAETVEIATKG